MSNIAAIPKDSVRVRNDRVIRLKEELNLILELVVHSREALTNELSTEFAQKKLTIDKPFLTKLKELTACYNSLTDARIRLDKAERSLEKDLSPAEEKEAVRDYVMSLTNLERGRFLKQMVVKHNSLLSGTINTTRMTSPESVEQAPEDMPDEA